MYVCDVHTKPNLHPWEKPLFQHVLSHVSIRDTLFHKPVHIDMVYECIMHMHIPSTPSHHPPDVKRWATISSRDLLHHDVCVRPKFGLVSNYVGRTQFDSENLVSSTIFEHCGCHANFER